MKNPKTYKKALNFSVPFFFLKKQKIGFLIKREKHIFAAGKKTVFFCVFN